MKILRARWNFLHTLTYTQTDMTHACVYGFAADKQIATRVNGLGGLLNGTVAILAQGTSWADAATQAFLRKVGICTE